MGYLCDTHPDQPGALLITMLATGDTAVLCGQCIHPWADAMAAATAPDTVEATDLGEHPDPITGDPTHDDTAGDPGATPDPGDPAVSPEPEPQTEGDDDGDELPELGELLEQSRPHLADEQEQATADA